MTRTAFQRPTRMRLGDARALLKAGNNEGAYYFAGLAVECGLKSAIARKIRRHDFPPEPKTVSQTVYVHDLNTLLAAAGLATALDTAAKADPALKADWALVKDWKNAARATAVSRMEFTFPVSTSNRRCLPAARVTSTHGNPEHSSIGPPRSAGAWARAEVKVRQKKKSDRNSDEAVRQMVK